MLSNGQKIILDPQKNSVGNISPVTLSNPNILNLQISSKDPMYDPLTENTINSNSVINSQDDKRVFEQSYFKNDNNNMNKKDKHDGYTSGGFSNIKNPIYYQPNINNYKQALKHNLTVSSKFFQQLS